MTNPSAESLNQEYPEVREQLGRASIETQISLLGAAVIPCEEQGLQGLMLQATDLNEHLGPIKVTLLPSTPGLKSSRSWFGAIPQDFYVRFYIEEIPELKEYTSDESLDELFFTTLCTNQKSAADLISFVLNSLRDEFGLELTFCTPKAE